MRSQRLTLLLLAGLLLGCPTTRSGLPTLADIEARGHRGIEPVDESRATRVIIRNATILTAAGKRHAPGCLIFSDRIEHVGPGDCPTGKEGHVIDAGGAVVTPGLIDTHSHLGVYAVPHVRSHSDGNEMTTPVTPGVWAEHSVWPQDPGFWRAMAGGITTLQILPGSGNLIGGRGVTLHLVPHRGSRAMRFPGAPDTIKMACGENPKRIYGKRKQAPSTRMGNLRGQRQAFAKAQRYREKGGEGRDLDLDALVGVLDGRILAHVHCYRADDMLSILQLADEFGFRIRSFHHALEAYKIRDVLAKAQVAVSTWADW